MRERPVPDKSQIMVVDDDWMHQEVLQAHLEGAGYQVSLANSGEAAIKLLGTQQPDLVLLDMRMQGVSGLEVCRTIKAGAATRHIPVLIITALDSDTQKQSAIDAGADDFVLKPIDSVIMLHRIKTLLRYKRFADILYRALDQHIDPSVAAVVRAELNE
jgi:DNA-binding response OmpR family regulator